MFHIITFWNSKELKGGPIPLEKASPWPSTGRVELKYLRTGVEVTACNVFVSQSSERFA